MPRGKESAYDQLEQLRAAAAAERVRAREAESRLEAAEHAAEDASGYVVEAIAAADEKVVRDAREAQDIAAVQVQRLGEEKAAAQLRVSRAQERVDVFAHDHATELLDERVAAAEEITAQLVAAVAATLKAHRALLDERQQMDRIIQQGGGSPRSDGAPAAHLWESSLNALERVVAQHPDLEPPRPRWHGRDAAHERDRVHGALQAQRAA